MNRPCVLRPELGLDLSSPALLASASRRGAAQRSAALRCVARWWMRNRYRVISVSDAPIMHILLSARSCAPREKSLSSGCCVYVVSARAMHKDDAEFNITR